MNTVVIVLILVALVLALVDEFQSRGSNLTAWAVVFLCAALLIVRLG